MQFPTGGTARDPLEAIPRPIRFESGADSTVWMKEDSSRDTEELTDL